MEELPKYPAALSDLSEILVPASKVKFLGNAIGQGVSRSHGETHEQIAKEINAITKELGTNPKAYTPGAGTGNTEVTYADVKTRLNSIEDRLGEVESDVGSGGGGETITVADTNSVDLVKSGSQITANVIISNDVNNVLEIRNNGLYVAPGEGGGGTAIDVVDTYSVNLTINENTLSAVVEISTLADNALELIADSVNPGLYVKDWKTEVASHHDGTQYREGTIIERVNDLETNNATNTVAISDITAALIGPTPVNGYNDLIGAYDTLAARLAAIEAAIAAPLILKTFLY